MLERNILHWRDRVDFPMVCTDVRYGNEAAVCRSHGGLAVVLCHEDTLASRRASCGYPDRIADPTEAMANRYLVALGLGNSAIAADELYRMAAADSVGSFVWNDALPLPVALAELARRPAIRVVDLGTRVVE
jgi:hypothetical protein